MNRRRVLALMGKECRELARDPLTIGLAILMPLVMLFLFGYAVTLDVNNIRLGVLDEDRSPASRELVDRFTASGYFEQSHAFDTPRQAEQALQRDQVRVVLVVPRRFQRALLRGETAPVQLLVDGAFASSAALALGYAEAIVASYPSAPRQRIETEVRVWYNPALRSANFVIPGLFAVILMAFPPLLTALAIVREKESGTIEQIYASPVTSAEFVLAKLLPYAGVALLEMALLVGVGILWFDIPFAGRPALLAAASGVYVLTTVGIGLLVSTITRTQLSAMLVALIVSLMPSFLFSGFLFPVFTMPLMLQLYSTLVPASYFVEISRDVVLKDAGLVALAPNLAWLALYTAVVFVFAAKRLRQKVAR
ncbi:MAG: ABC transporter permease [Arenimonas sp.]|nr:ABC transporter permease [Arenimonas sp.]